jgi:glucosamine-6-phosphate deaminase
MTSQLDPNALAAWCRIPAEALETHPDRKIPLVIVDQPADVHQWAGRAMADEVKANNAAGNPTRWILACGPTGQYRAFTEIVNREQISLANVLVFHMDEYLDWQGRPVPPEHSFNLRTTMDHIFYEPVDSTLRVPLEQRFYPSVYDIDRISADIERVGGIDTMYGGIGYRGHLAFNEPPHAPWYTVTAEQFRNSKTRILPISVDSIIARSVRDVGGLSHMVPPMAITLGMKDLLAARRIRLLVETGEWKQAVIRVLLFGPETTEYPVTFVQSHQDVRLVIDRRSAGAPLGA